MTFQLRHFPMELSLLYIRNLWLSQAFDSDCAEEGISFHEEKKCVCVCVCVCVCLSFYCLHNTLHLHPAHTERTRHIVTIRTVLISPGMDQMAPGPCLKRALANYLESYVPLIPEVFVSFPVNNKGKIFKHGLSC